jgi:hypothetical protein
MKGLPRTEPTFLDYPSLTVTTSTMSHCADVASTWCHSEERSDEESRSWSAGCPDLPGTRPFASLRVT